jgi:hypothetical protein
LVDYDRITDMKKMGSFKITDNRTYKLKGKREIEGKLKVKVLGFEIVKVFISYTENYFFLIKLK